ncbi:hypothetical protein ABEB36_004610 [Hypothenemus hampei]|uniref:Uncharacterized protein n=1 Tax=Hypothenemus hampei TaxID=57062 RepID=A0ABD1F3W8_HYPHA
MSYWEEVVAVLRTVPEISEWFEAEDPANLKEITRVTLEIWKEATLYQGFDVYRIIKLLRANYQAYMASLLEEQVSYEVTVNGTKKTFRYSNNEKLTTDIHFILFLFANRGCSVQKVLEKSTDQIRTVMDWLISKLNLDITENEPGRSLGPDIITIPRIAACFPTVFCNVFHAREAKPIVTLSQLNLPESTSHAVLCPALASCVPPECIEKAENVHIVFFCVHVLLDDVLHKKDKRLTELDQMFAYYKAAYGSVACHILYDRNQGD